MPVTNGQTVIDRIKYMRQTIIQRIIELRAKLGLSGQPLYLGMFSGFQKPSNTATSTNIPLIRAPAAAAASGSYKNTEEWEIWEEKGKLKVRVHRDAKRG